MPMDRAQVGTRHKLVSPTHPLGAHVRTRKGKSQKARVRQNSLIGNHYDKDNNTPTHPHVRVTQSSIKHSRWGFVLVVLGVVLLLRVGFVHDYE